MIPYDDLVAALSAWRARQGLPVSTLGGGTAAAPAPGSGPHAQPGSGPYGQPGSGPYGQPGSGPTRGTPPGPPPGRNAPTPPPLEAGDDLHEVDDAEMLDEQYENEGSDFAMSFGGGNGDDSTSIGGAPERPTDPSDFGGRGGRGGRGEDW
jgi:hypothetical protein